MVVCSQCQKDTQALKYCAKCQVAGYCSRDCQVAAWPTHKIQCKEFRTNKTTGILRYLPTRTATQSYIDSAYDRSTTYNRNDIFVSDARFGVALASYLTATKAHDFDASHKQILQQAVDLTDSGAGVVTEGPGSEDWWKLYFQAVLEVANSAQAYITFDQETQDHSGVVYGLDMLGNWLRRSLVWTGSLSKDRSGEVSRDGVAMEALATSDATARVLKIVGTELLETVAFKVGEMYFIGVAMFGENDALCRQMLALNWYVKGTTAFDMLPRVREVEKALPSKPVDPALRDAVAKAMEQQAEEKKAAADSDSDAKPRETELLVSQGIFGTYNVLALIYTAELQCAAWGVTDDAEKKAKVHTEAVGLLEKHIALVSNGGPLADYGFSDTRSQELLKKLKN